MAFKLKASKKTEEILTQLESSTKIPYATLIKLSIALSLKQGKLEEDDYNTNTLGRELNRQTITGDADALYKCLFELCEEKHLTDEDYFPTAVKAHLDRGAIILQNEYKYAGHDFLTHLANLDQGI